MKRIVRFSCLLLVMVTFCFAQTGRPGTRTPTVSYLEGTVTIDGQEASIGGSVLMGAVVVTAAQSLVDIEFNIRNAIRLAENTTFVFNPFNLQTGSELRQGALTLVLKNLSKGTSGENFLVRTPSAVAGVRGTSFFMKVESPTSTYVCACNGEVQVLGQNGNSLRDLLGSHHKAVRIERTGGNPQVTDAPMLYHTDADVERVAADIGYKIDWTVVDH